MITEIKTPINLTTVRIVAINVRGQETYDVLIVAIMGGYNLIELQKVRIYLKDSEFDNLKMLSIANSFYLKLVKYRLQLGKKVYDRHIYKVYNEIAELERVIGSTPFVGVKQLYIKKRKHPYTVLRSPRKGYKEIKSDTLRLILRDMIIENEQKLYQEKLEKIEKEENDKNE